MSLVAYEGSSSSSDEDASAPTTEAINIPSRVVKLNSAPNIDESMVLDVHRSRKEFNPLGIGSSKELSYNPRYEDLYAPVVGPRNPFKREVIPNKNFLTGHVEMTNLSEYAFEEARKEKFLQEAGERCNSTDYQSLRVEPAREPDGKKVELDGKRVELDGKRVELDGKRVELDGKRVELDGKKVGPDGSGKRVEPDSKRVEPDSKRVEPDGSSKGRSRRRRVANRDATDVDGYTGPWCSFEDEVKVARPGEDDQAVIDAWMAKKKKYTLKVDKEEVEKSHLHIPDPYDYQGRSFLHAPQDLDGVNLRPDHVPAKCFIPKKVIHTYTGHSKSLTAIRWFPRSAHLFLSAGMDGKINLWEVFNQRRNILTFLGHKSAVRDLCFNRFGDNFLSTGYDRSLKLWDTETGQCVKKFSNRKVAYCVKFNPDDERSHLFLSGMNDKKILCWDSRSGGICQEYDRHLGPINTITFVDNNRRFVSTSDDKSIRVWEWDIPVDIKYIADAALHAVPAVTQAPNGKWLACQMMDNKIQAFACMNRFKLNPKKIFSGHMVAGYACSPDFSPDMSFLSSGDADGKVYVWDWKTTKLLQTFQAHENVCISTLWHPHETSKLLTAGWDNLIKLWD